jgi:hypothetical protein
VAKTNVYLKFDIHAEETPPHLEEILQDEVVIPLQEDDIHVTGTGIVFSTSQLVFELNLEFEDNIEVNFVEFFEYVCGEISAKLSDYQCYVNNYTIEFD